MIPVAYNVDADTENMPSTSSPGGGFSGTAGPDAVYPSINSSKKSTEVAVPVVLLATLHLADIL